MKKLKFVVSLITTENDYQLEQAVAAEAAARRLGADVQILYAENDAITQSTQLLKVIQSSTDRPDAIVFEPAGGTAFPQVAHAAASAGIGWVVLNREAGYLPELRKSCRAPIFSVSSDHVEIGRTQGRQFAALLPKGGHVLYLQGPSDNSAARDRALGMQQTKPGNIQVMSLKGQWTEESGQRTVLSWLKLTTAHKAQIDLIGSQNDVMAIGARKAFKESFDVGERERWLSLPYTGCDGLPKTGQEWVLKGLLAATIVVPPNTGQAMEMVAKAIQTGEQPPERVLTVPHSFPSIEKLTALGMERARHHSA